MKSIRKLWSLIARRGPEPEPPAEVIVHDPSAQKPHDLDDPFFDPEVQARMAGVIANNATKSPKP